MPVGPGCFDVARPVDESCMHCDFFFFFFFSPSWCDGSICGWVFIDDTRPVNTFIWHCGLLDPVTVEHLLIFLDLSAPAIDLWYVLLVFHCLGLMDPTTVGGVGLFNASV